MMSTSEEPGCLKKIGTGWEEFLSWLKFKHSVHPIDAIAPEYSEFIIINSDIRIRCIHINPEKLRKSKVLEFQKYQVKDKRNTVSEEYWFTKWNKPIKSVTCNCSFRKSLRLSLSSSPDVNLVDSPPVCRTSALTPLKWSSIEALIERLIENCIDEAIQEFYALRTTPMASLGYVNFAFNGNEQASNSDSCMVDSKQEIRNKSSKNQDFTDGIPQRESSNQSDLPNNLNNSSEFNRCRHKKTKLKKPLVILFHGIGTSSDIWWIVIKSLVSKGYEIVAPDMLGHGFSSAPTKERYYFFRNLLLHALAIFDNYVGADDNRKCILIGHSYGCSVATALYHHRMRLISQMILISGGGPTPLAPPVHQDELIYTEFFQALIQPLIFCGMNRSLFYSSRGKFFDYCGDYAGIPNHVLHSVRMGQNWPEGDAALHRRIFVPTLLVHGLLDKHVTLVQECEMERTIPRSFLELIPNAGHMPMVETPEHLTHMILCFLDYWS